MDSLGEAVRKMIGLEELRETEREGLVCVPIFKFREVASTSYTLCFLSQF